VLWEPGDAERDSAMGRFARAVGQPSYLELWRWSVVELDEFWRTLADLGAVAWRRPPDAGVALAHADMPGARWFPGAELNYAEHALAHAAREPDAPAVIAHSQTRPRSELTWGELADAVERCAAGLRSLGVQRGDRVAGYLPNTPEAVVACLATAAIGAVWSSCPPEFGTRAVVDRFGPIEPTVLLAVDGYRYGEEVIERRREVEALVEALPSLRAVVPVAYLGVHPDGWADLLDHPAGHGFEPVPFDHPLWILFSSGTTGLPKPIVHGHGGITLEHLKALHLHHDLHAGDRFLWFSTTGWMMWNYLLSGLLVGATIVLFDGDPTWPDPSTLWRVAATEDCALFGSSAGLITASRAAGVVPERAGLRSIGSTGSPLPPAGYEWAFAHLGVPIVSISGGTDVCTAFVGGSPLSSVRVGEISCPLLGCAVAAVDGAGRPLPPGTTGELVVTEPMPSMPVGFWGDDGSRLRRAYYERFEGWWHHGDWITLFGDGASVISGRSDATLNRGGVRIGTADLYSVVEAVEGVADALAVHLDDPTGEGGGELVLFLVASGGVAGDDARSAALQAEVRRAVRTELSPRHVPDRVELVRAVPRTSTGKRLEVPVKRLLTTGAAEVATDALADPQAWHDFVALASRWREPSRDVEPS
jgi:acetoacetyl-CoA synthetase